MKTTYWHKQGGEALFAELEWNKPERRDQAGRLLLIGGNTHALLAIATSYEQTIQHGIGTVKVVLPDKTKGMLGQNFSDAVFLPSTPTGEFSQEGENELAEYAQWADAVLIPGDIGRNSQTSILLESFLRSYTEQIVLTKDSIEALGTNPKILLTRPNTTLVLSFSQLQRVLKNSANIKALRFSMNIVQLVDYLHELTKTCRANIVTLLNNQLIVASDGNISTTKISENNTEERWRLAYANLAICYHIWYPNKPFEALTHSAHLLQSTYEA